MSHFVVFQILYDLVVYSKLFFVDGLHDELFILGEEEEAATSSSSVSGISLGELEVGLEDLLSVGVGVKGANDFHLGHPEALSHVLEFGPVIGYDFPLGFDVDVI